MWGWNAGNSRASAFRRLIQNKDGRQADIEKVAKQCKAQCMSIKFKLEVLEKELKAEKENNIKLSEQLLHNEWTKIKVGARFKPIEQYIIRRF